MAKRLALHFLILSTTILVGISAQAQSQRPTGDTKPPKKYDNVHVEKIHEDSLSSTFIIWVKKSVRTHKHLAHSENIYVLEGKAIFTLGDTSFVIKKGDIIFVSKNTWHAAKTISRRPLKVISVQSPHFDGTDRVFKSD